MLDLLGNALGVFSLLLMGVMLLALPCLLLRHLMRCATATRRTVPHRKDMGFAIWDPATEQYKVVRPLILLVTLLTLGYAADAQACRRCHVATCYGCNYTTPSSNYTTSGYDAPYILHEDGTWWLDGVEYKRGKKLCSTSATGWCWAWYPVKKAGVPQVPVPIAAQGSTIFGYQQTDSYARPGYSAFSAAYQTDPALFMNQAGRLQKDAQDNAAKGYTTFATLAANLTSQGQDAAKIQAYGQALAAAIAAGNPAQSQRSFSATQSYGQSTPQVNAFSSGQISQELAGAIQNNCAQCHLDDKKGGLDLNQVASFDLGQFDRLIERITTSDPVKHMPPPGDDGQPHVLGNDDLQAFFAHRAKLRRQ